MQTIDKQEVERKAARNWYWWLWLSPLLTLPTLAIIRAVNPGFDLICGGLYRGCDFEQSHRVTDLIGILCSGMWHLVLLIPALNKVNSFERWHGRQALFLAGLRTAFPFGISLLFARDSSIILSIPILLLLWFFGTLWGQLQAINGKCSLARMFGQNVTLPASSQTTDSRSFPKIELKQPSELMEIIRHHTDQNLIKNALEELNKLDLVAATFSSIAESDEENRLVEEAVETIRRCKFLNERDNALGVLRASGRLAEPF